MQQVGNFLIRAKFINFELYLEWLNQWKCLSLLQIEYMMMKVKIALLNLDNTGALAHAFECTM